MAEHDPRAVLEQSGDLRGTDRRLLEVQFVAGTQDRDRVTGRLGGDDQQEPLGGGRERPDLT